MASSFRFLNPSLLPEIFSAFPLSDCGTSFIGASTGFLPPAPLPSLPKSHRPWQDIANQLPATIRSGQWQPFIDSLPDLSVQSLDDCHLLRANMCLGAIAHALRNVAEVDVLPECVMRPWNDVGKRLERPTASFNSLDWFVYNYEFIPHRFVRRIDNTSTPKATVTGMSLPVSSLDHCHQYSTSRQNRLAVTNAWLHTRPMFTVSGTMTESHFITSCYAIELAAIRLPGLIATVQQAVHDDTLDVVLSGLQSITSIIESMTTAFLSCDMRPLSATYVDGVEWGRVIGVTGQPVVPGEKTISGLLFPSIHLLDVFFCRSQYYSDMGVLEETDRKWLPPLHRKFLAAVGETSVMDYVIRQRTRHPRLMMCLQNAVACFAAEAGFLGKHRLRIVGFLELSMKVGRPGTAAGTVSMKWQKRMWRHINRAMMAGIHERLQNANIPIVTGAGPVVRARVVGVEAMNGSDNNCIHASTFRVILNTEGLLLYSPGDHIGVMPRNSMALVNTTLKALDMQHDDTVVVQSTKWREMLQTYYYRERYAEEKVDNMNDDNSNDTQLSMTAQEFLSMASLQPMDSELANRLIDAMLVTDPAVMAYLRDGTAATNVAMALEATRNTDGVFTLGDIRSRVDSVFEPLAPRYYSVSSHRAFTPTSVELIVGRVRYQPTIYPFTGDDGRMMMHAGPMMNSERQMSVSVPSLGGDCIKPCVQNNEFMEPSSWSSLDSHVLSSFYSSSLENHSPSSTFLSTSSDTGGSTCMDDNDYEDVSNIKKNCSDDGVDNNCPKCIHASAHDKSLHVCTQALSTTSIGTDLDLPQYYSPYTHCHAQPMLTSANARDHSSGYSVNMLEGVSSSFLTRSQLGTIVPIFTVPELDFRLPKGTSDVPVVLLSLGTGISPFRSFLKELIVRKQQSGGRKFNQAWLIMGVQTRAQIPFVNEIEEAVCEHGVADISIAFSREDIDIDLRKTKARSRLSFRPGKRKRVQGLFEEGIDDQCEELMEEGEKEENVSQRLWNVVRNGGHIYACGKPDLEPLVRELVSFAVRRCAPATMIGSRTYFDINYDLDAVATEYADRMFGERRLHIDAYSSGSSSSSSSSSFSSSHSRSLTINSKTNKTSSNINIVNKSNKSNQKNTTTYSHSEVAQHHHATDCWVTFRNDVYDLTKYLAVHPGGPKLLLDKAGRDLTEDFDIAHGRNNSRVASMLLPYRIGTLNTYTCRSCTNNNSNSNLQTVSRLKECIMDQWSVPLLHTVLEHRSVFLLDVNRFDSLWEPPSHTVFKSQIDQPGGLTSVVVDKFLTQYEPDLFKTVLNAVGADKLGAAVKAIHCCDDQGVVPSGVGIVKKERADDGDEMMFPDFEAVQRTIKQFRTVQIGNHNFQRKSPELSLDRCSRFLNYLVATCVEMQQTVEMALKDASKEGNFKHACTMLSNLIRIMSDGIERAYTVLAVNRLTFNWR